MHEILHSVHQSKEKRYILKLDYEKSYDNKSGVYDTQSFYVIINYRGITPLYIPAI
jgi:hypothetical protein